jgi:integrase
MSKHEYASVFKTQIHDYMGQMRSVGYHFDTAAEVLWRFDRFCLEQGYADSNLSRFIVEGWNKRRPHESIRTQLQRISAVRGLARHIVRSGKEAFVTPGTNMGTERYSYQPHIFTSDEMGRLLAACDSFVPCPASPRRHIVMPMLIRLTYGCALRISEARKLEVRDVNLSEGTLTIRNTKFNKSRIVPVADGLTRNLGAYHETLLVGKADDYPFFPSHRGCVYSHAGIYCFFREALYRAGIPHTGKGPRIHDLRHTAACRCLQEWARTGRDLTNCLPYLSVYLGHEDLRGTQHYLRLSAEMYPDIVCDVEKSCSWMIPEVTVV